MTNTMEYKIPLIKAHNHIVDSVLKENWGMVEKYVQQFEENIKEQRKREGKEFKGFIPYDRSLYALSFVMDFNKAMSRIIEKGDKYIRSEMKFNRGQIQGLVEIERKGVKYVIQTKGTLAGGYNIQRLHIRYLLKTDLPKKKVPKDVNMTLQEYEENLKFHKKIKEKLDSEYYQNELKKKLNFKKQYEKSILLGKEKIISERKSELLKSNPYQEINPSNGKPMFKSYYFTKEERTSKNGWTRIETVEHIKWFDTFEEKVNFDAEQTWLYTKNRPQKLQEEIEQLKKNQEKDKRLLADLEQKLFPKTNPKEELEKALKGIEMAINLSGETEDLIKAKKGVEVALKLI